MFCACFFAPGCRKDEDDNAYQGVSKLITERHKARLAQSAGMKKQISHEKARPLLQDQDTTEETIIEEKVKIISASSGKPIANATAYLDKNGKIINIMIERD